MKILYSRREQTIDELANSDKEGTVSHKILVFSSLLFFFCFDIKILEAANMT